MKEKYFDSKIINAQAKKFLQAIKKYQNRISPVFDLKSSALLILDMQKFFTDSDSHAFIPSSQAILPNILELQKYFLKDNLTVIQTRHINNIDNAGQLMNWWQDIIRAQDPRSSIDKKIYNPGAMVIVKSQYDAFHGTDLLNILRKRKIKQIIICGVMTHLCCETTARSAFVNGFEVFFPVDATATYNRKFHLASLINLAHGFAYPLLTQDILFSHKPPK